MKKPFYLLFVLVLACSCNQNKEKKETTTEPIQLPIDSIRAIAK